MFKSKLAMLFVVAAVAVVSMASLPGAASAAGGDSTCVVPFGSVDYSDIGYGGQAFTITVIGSGNTDLDLFVYDEAGNLVVADTIFGDFAQVTVLPYYTQWMTIRVVNNGGDFNCYTISVL